MNIIEAYLKFNKKLIFLVSGLPGCGKTSLANNIHNTFKLQLLHLSDYRKKDLTKKVLPNKIEVVNYYTINAIDWDKLNDDVNKYKNKGIIVTGFAFPHSLLKFIPDFHINLAITKQICLEKRKKFLSENKDKFKVDYELMEKGHDKLIMNNLIYPYYIKNIKESRIDKYIRALELSSDEIFDGTFNIIVKFIESNIYSKQIVDFDELSSNDKINKSNKLSKTDKSDKFDKKDEDSDSDDSNVEDCESSDDDFSKIRKFIIAEVDPKKYGWQLDVELY